MKKILVGLSLLTLSASANAEFDFFGSNGGEWKMGSYGPYYEESNWPEWTPMYWMEEMMDSFDDDDDYGSFSGMPFSNGNSFNMPFTGGNGNGFRMPFNSGNGFNMPFTGNTNPYYGTTPMMPTPLPYGTAPMQPPLPYGMAPAAAVPQIPVAPAVPTAPGPASNKNGVATQQ